MKLHLLDRSTLNNNTFSIKKNCYPYFLKLWHHHPDLELVVISKSTGTCFAGDAIEKFEINDVVLIGENLPHMWLNDEIYFRKNSKLLAEAIAIHFKKDFLGKHFFEIPEMNKIQNLFLRSQKGIKFMNVSPKTIKEIENLLTLTGFERMISFLSILNKLAKHKKYKVLASDGFLNTFNKSENKVLDKVYEYIFKNFSKPITLNEIAEVANMNPSAFSRFFKRVNRKLFSKYLNEIRIGYACKLLMEQNNSIASICYESGFNNLSNFNRQFKLITKMSPKAYIKQHQSEND